MLDEGGSQLSQDAAEKKHNQAAEPDHYPEPQSAATTASTASRILQTGFARHVPSRENPSLQHPLHGNPLLRSVSMLGKAQDSASSTGEHPQDSALYGSIGQDEEHHAGRGLVAVGSDEHADPTTNDKRRRRNPSPSPSTLLNALKAKGSSTIGGHLRTLRATASDSGAAAGTALPIDSPPIITSRRSSSPPSSHLLSTTAAVATQAKAQPTVVSQPTKSNVVMRETAQAAPVSAPGAASSMYNTGRRGRDANSPSRREETEDVSGVPPPYADPASSGSQSETIEQLAPTHMPASQERSGRPSFSYQSSRRPSHASVHSQQSRKSIASRLGFGGRDDSPHAADVADSEGQPSQKRRPSTGTAAMELLKSVTRRKGKSSSGSSSSGSGSGSGSITAIAAEQSRVTAGSGTSQLDASASAPRITDVAECPNPSRSTPRSSHIASPPAEMEDPSTVTRPSTASSFNTFHTTQDDTPESSPDIRASDVGPEHAPFLTLSNGDIVGSPLMGQRHRIDWIDSFGPARPSPSESTSAGSATEYTFGSHGTSVHAASPSHSMHVQATAIGASPQGLDFVSAGSKGKERADSTSPLGVEGQAARPSQFAPRATSVGLNEEQAASSGDYSFTTALSSTSATTTLRQDAAGLETRRVDEHRRPRGASDRNSLLHLPHLHSFEHRNDQQSGGEHLGVNEADHEEPQEVDESDTDSDQGDHDDTVEHGVRTDAETSSETELDDTEDETEAEASPSAELPSPFAAPPRGFESGHRPRPQGIVIPPPPTFRPQGIPTPRFTDQATVRASIRPPTRRIPTYDELHPSGAAPPPTPNVAVGRQTWAQFSSTTPAEASHSQTAEATPSTSIAMRTPRHAVGVSEASYFTHQPALAQSADTLMDGAPPPSPSVITRSRAPSSASSRRSGVAPMLNIPLPTPKREIPSLPAIGSLAALKFEPAISRDRPASRERSVERVGGVSSIRRDGSMQREARPRPVTTASSSSSIRANGERSLLEKQARLPTSALVDADSQTRSSHNLQPPIPTSAESPRLGLYRLKSQSLIELSSPTRREAGEESLTGRVAGATPTATPHAGLQALTPDSIFSNRYPADGYEPPPTPMSGNAPSLRRRSMIQLGVEPPAYSMTHMRPDGTHTIVPREEEGREKLPPYTCSVHIEGFLPRKMEFSAPGVQAKDRGWKRQYVVLHGTALHIYKNDTVASLASTGAWGHMEGVHVYGERMDEEPSPIDGIVVAKGVDGSSQEAKTHGTANSHTEGRRHSEGGGLRMHMPGRLTGHHNSSSGAAMSSVAQAVGATTRSSLSHIGGLGIANMPASPSGPWNNPRLAEYEARTRSGIVRSYTLQSAESGLAADYLKRRHVVRVRAEGEQFLLQTNSDRAVVALIEALQAATNVSMDLERRTMPKFITLPRRNRRRRRRNPDGTLGPSSSTRPRATQGGGDVTRADREGRNPGTENVNAAGAGQQSSSAYEEMLREEHAEMASQPAAIG